MYDSSSYKELQMRTIYFATQNQGKVNSLRREVERLNNLLIFMAPFDIPEPRGEDVKEIALAKVRYAKGIITRAAVIALDAGFYIDCLDGYPGVSIKAIYIKSRIKRNHRRPGDDSLGVSDFCKRNFLHIFAARFGNVEWSHEDKQVVEPLNLTAERIDFALILCREIDCPHL